MRSSFCFPIQSLLKRACVWFFITHSDKELLLLLLLLIRLSAAVDSDGQRFTYPILFRLLSPSLSIRRFSMPQKATSKKKKTSNARHVEKMQRQKNPHNLAKKWRNRGFLAFFPPSEKNAKNGRRNTGSEKKLDVERRRRG